MELFCIQSQDGKFYKATGMNGRGRRWNDSLSSAKFYNKIGPVKAQVTFWANENPEYGVPKILKFTLNPEDAEVINMEDYVEKGNEKREKVKTKRKIANLEYERQRLEAEIKKSTEELNGIKRKSQENS